MDEFPEIARRRLGRIVVAGDHPDAGLLTAFVEGTLADAHRDYIFDHLAACSECNRLIALIAPEQQVAPVVAPIAIRRPWFSWAPLRWAGAAAAVAVVASAVWIGRVEQTVNPPATPAIAVEKALPATAAQPPAAPSSIAQADRTAPSAHRQGRGSHQLAKAKPEPQPPQFNPMIAAQSRPAVPGDVRDRSAFQTSVISGADTPNQVSPAAPEPLQPVQPELAPSKPILPPVPARAIGPVWSLNDAGVLQRSDDSGKTWAAVPVPSSASMRAVSVLGQDIWIGGDHGSLLHSADDGRTWTAVAPSANGQILSDDIARIVFFDIRHGWIATRQGRIWTTHDSGATWLRK
jgi:Photosynthesis system II assembly factor YCF48